MNSHKEVQINAIDKKSYDCLDEVLSDVQLWCEKINRFWVLRKEGGWVPGPGTEELCDWKIAPSGNGIRG